jgi:iron complex transport system substrate-binding protein
MHAGRDGVSCVAARDTTPRGYEAACVLTRRRFCLLAAAQGFVACMPRRVSAEPAERVACIDWAAAESLAWLGVMPVAVPDLATYRRWLPEPALPETTVNLGTRSEPNLELLAEIRPDRIIVSSWQAGMLPRFARIAPAESAVVFDARRRPYARIRELLLDVGRLVGREDVARRRLSESDETLDALRRMLSVRACRSVYVVVLNDDGAQAFVYGKGSWVETMMGRIGLRNAWVGPTSFYGNSLVGIAELAADPDAAILYLDQGARTRRAETRLRASTLWRRLPAVANGRALSIPAFYALGGLPSALRCARILARAMGDVAKGGA